MPIRWTSRLSLLAEADRLNGLRLEVYTAIRKWDPVDRGPGPSIEDLARELGRKESSICGRIAELRNLGLIAEAPLKHNTTGQPAMTYTALAYRTEPSNPDIHVDRSGQLEFFASCNSASNPVHYP